MAINAALTYKNNMIGTATPAELTLMLYDGAIKFVAQSIQALAGGDFQLAHNANLRAQAIVRELKAAGYRHVSLDLQGYRMGSLNEGLVLRPA